MNPEWRSRYDLAIEVAREAGDLAKRYYDSGFEVEWKADQSPVTVADKQAEELIRTRITKHFPGDGFLGEEYGDEPSSSGFRWVIDPIDGTRAFVRHIPIWGTLLGLEYRDDAIAGVAYAPSLGNLWRGLRGDGAYCDDRKIHVSDVEVLNRAFLSYSGVNWFKKSGYFEQFVDLCNQTERQRGIGDFYGFMLVAQGSIDVMVDHGVHAWDVAALLPIVEEAGGVFTDWTGQRTIHSVDVVASNKPLHPLVQRILQPGERAPKSFP
ncbi:inositol monophosphatase family protein [Limnoglobus roseus]|uniref:Histidinol phosphate phosphatase n=1 Tax=Limnoglobus roseus TaxID=2598579 RepID=A0A5C1AIX3_9BACT|nr:inositol monophosphatase family protein [Limnoglobus roseus]QEL19389.1 histidinol phosphate phosphatase [Limnoglobus roseus]